MSNYIDRKALIEATEETQFTMSHFPNKDQCDGANMARRTFARIFRTIPAADVAPVRHGRWIRHGKPNERLQQYEVLFWSCSHCGQIERNMTPYCCSCGAKMDGGAE